MILRRAAYRAVRWANGGGITHDIVVAGDPPQLRLSLATIDRDGPFSHLTGYDRTLVAAGGGGFRLTFADGAAVVLALPGDRHDFRGEDAPACALLDGPALAFNVMTMRGAARAGVDVARLSSGGAWSSVGPATFFVIDGEVSIAGEIARRHDTVVLDGAAAMSCPIPSIVVVVHSPVKSTRNT